ncbi:MAG TPA: DNA/RNA non-specific endonuclease [Burkholderiales bacterium]
MRAGTDRFKASLTRAKAAHLDSLLKGVRVDEEREATASQVEARRLAIQRNLADPLAARVRLERILKGNDLSDISYLEQGLVAGRPVCRIVLRRNGSLVGYGTGFLVAPGVLLTNEHVFEDPSAIQESIAQFRYERDVRGMEIASVDFGFRLAPAPIISKELDFTLVQVEPRSPGGAALEPFGWLRLDPTPGKAFVGEYLTIIQHPKGERKQICVRENKLLKYADKDPYVWYETDTVSGSSGSPVFNNSWDVVALHHSSVPETKRVGGKDVWLTRDGKVWSADMSEDEIAWKANEGIRVSRIVEHLSAKHATHPLAKAVLTAKDARAAPILGGGESIVDASDIQVRTDGAGNMRILIPVDIKVGAYGLPADVPSKVSTQVSIPPQVVDAPSPLTIEKVVVNQSNYAKRNGYDPQFLGSAAVPLPKVAAGKFGKVFLLPGKKVELKYWNYSVVLNQVRALAYFSAANVDSASFRGNRDADGDTWFRDTRVDAVDKAAQTGAEFYKKQSTFEADRSKNPFDQGHLTRRSDLQWGADDKTAKRNGDDSYHYTNCTPQHWQFNQNNRASAATGIWFRLEDAAIASLADGATRLCVISGPVFDAPLCKAGTDGRLRLNLKGKRVPDETFGGLKIPRQFFKVIAYVSGQALKAKAFLVTQEDLLEGIARLRPEEAALSALEIRLYQVRIAELERLTGLDFGPLSAHDAKPGQESLVLDESLPVVDAAEIRF